MRLKRVLPNWLIGVIVTLYFLFASATGKLDLTEPLELKSFDLRARLAASDDPDPDIELVVITDEDLSQLGRFPWPRNILAAAIRNLSAAGAGVVALNIPFPEPEESAGLRAVKNLKREFDLLLLGRQGPGLVFANKLSQTVQELDHDAELAGAIREAGNVVLPIHFDTQGAGRDRSPPEFMAPHLYKKVENGDEERSVASLFRLSGMKPLLPSLAEGAAGIGHVNVFSDPDGTIRNQVHVVGYLDNMYVPSFPVAVVRAYKRLGDEDVVVLIGRGVQLRVSPSEVLTVPAIDPQMRTLIRWHGDPGIAFHRTPFSKVYKNQIQPGLFKDKIVIVGPTATGTGDRFATPISGQLPGVEVIATSVANILRQRFFSRQTYLPLVETGVLVLFGMFISFVLPRVSAGVGAWTTLLLFLSCGVVGCVLFFSYGVWLKVVPPMSLLAVGYILVVPGRFFLTGKRKERVEADPAETDKMLGLSFQQQGMLDLALEKFLKIPLETEGIKDLLYNLGIEFERKRQFDKALSTYKIIVGDGHDFKDLDERIPRLKNAEATLVFGQSGRTHPGEIGTSPSAADATPILGRYRVVEEIGRGAMGVVYKGEDPKIHRVVAIKTVRLSEFDEDVVQEIKERFFREAESAGLLAHPNIVTIYDCGEEQDLAYIAMEYLEGEDLAVHADPQNLLPLREALSVAAKVAEALDYAHDKGIVHRDVKPANIMRIKGTNEVKVMDFGIARIATSSKTRTGVVLGTPLYMSPEQIAGKKVDGRSDVFSLGAVLFELLTGEKPFKGDDLTSLMYRIAKEKHLSVTAINPRVPAVVEQIINRALEKDPEKRYAKAGRMAEHLQKVVARIDELRAGKKL
jgi:serine/threonine-protein kinase